MKKMLFLITLMLVPCMSGCFFTGLGVVMGTAVRLPFEITGQVLTGFEEGLNGTGTLRKDKSYSTPTHYDSTGTYEYNNSGKYSRDANGNITW